MNKILLFIFITFFISWSTVPFLTINNKISFYVIVALLYMPAPLYATLILEKFNRKKTSNYFNFKSLNFKSVILPFIILLSFNILFITIVYLFGNIFDFKGFGELDFSKEAFLEQILEAVPSANPSVINLPNNTFGMLIIIILFGSISGAIINFPFALGEELGWRGFLFKEIKTNFFYKSLIIGSIWGIWHIPLIIKGYNFHNTPITGSVIMILFCIISSFSFNAITKYSQSIIPATLLHGGFNATVPALNFFIKNENQLLINPVGIIGLFIFILIFLLINGKNKFIVFF